MHYFLSSDESDIEIIIPTDSDDEEVPYTSKTDHNSEVSFHKYHQ